MTCPTCTAFSNLTYSFSGSFLNTLIASYHMGLYVCFFDWQISSGLGEQATLKVLDFWHTNGNLTEIHKQVPRLPQLLWDNCIVHFSRHLNVPRGDGGLVPKHHSHTNIPFLAPLSPFPQLVLPETASQRKSAQVFVTVYFHGNRNKTKLSTSYFLSWWTCSGKSINHILLHLENESLPRTLSDM